MTTERFKVLLRVGRALATGKITLAAPFGRRLDWIGDHRTFEVQVDDGLESLVVRYAYGPFILQHRQQPPGSYHEASGVLRRLGLMPPGVREAPSYRYRFRGCWVEWRPESGLWPPSLSSFTVAATILDQSSRPGRVWDVGCGSGIVGLLVARLADRADVTLSDVDPRGVELAKENADRLGVVGANFVVEPFPPERRPSLECDLLVSNPPWFHTECQLGNPSEWPSLDKLPLLTALLTHGLEWGRRVVVTFSGMLWNDVSRHLSAIETSGGRWRILRRDRLPVPMRILQVEPRRQVPPGLFRDETWPPAGWAHEIIVCELSSPGADRHDQ